MGALDELVAGVVADGVADAVADADADGEVLFLIPLDGSAGADREVAEEAEFCERDGVIELGNEREWLVLFDCQRPFLLRLAGGRAAFEGFARRVMERSQNSRR